MSWGKLGHRITGEVAQFYLSQKAHKGIKSLIKNESLARISNYADFIKSDPKMRRKYNHIHYLSVGAGLSVKEQLEKKPQEENIISAINDFLATLSSSKTSKEKKSFALKMLVHLIGDLHQPLHVGKHDDKGGNKITVNWFGKKTNLHLLWDQELIQMQKMSYSEFAKELIETNTEDVKKLQKDNLLTWAQESHDYLGKLYKFKERRHWEYDYNYVHKNFLEERLFKAGVRLAGLLNRIFK